MGISSTAILNCKYCIETIKHVYIDYENGRSLWKAAAESARLFHGRYFKISDVEQIFGDEHNNQVKKLILISVGD